MYYSEIFEIQSIFNNMMKPQHEELPLDKDEAA